MTLDDLECLFNVIQRHIKIKKENINYKATYAVEIVGLL